MSSPKPRHADDIITERTKEYRNETMVVPDSVVPESCPIAAD